jgi:hypothetical protein
MNEFDTWWSSDHSYVKRPVNAQEGPLWPRFNGRLHRSCETVEAMPGPKESAYLAFPAVCHEAEACELWRACLGWHRRDQVIKNARLAVQHLKTPALKRL